MRLTHELRYDATPDEVYGMLADPAFREATCRAMDVVSVEVTLTETDEGFDLVVDQVQRTDDLPSFARTFAGSTTRAVQRETWADRTGAQLAIEAPGTPSDVRGTISLQPDGDGTREVVDLELKIKVPLIGGKLEKLLAEKITGGLDTEQRVGAAWLAGER